MTTVLICGSRHWTSADTPVVKAYVRARVEGIKAKGFDLIAGDAFGVDQWVAEAAQAVGQPIVVVGITPQPRHEVWGAPTTRYRWFTPDTSGVYRDRDRHMVEQCDLCLAIWNGKPSRAGGLSGTQRVYQYALKQGKACWLVALETIRGLGGQIEQGSN